MSDPTPQTPETPETPEPGISTGREAEVTTEEGTTIAHAEQTEVSQAPPPPEGTSAETEEAEGESS